MITEQEIRVSVRALRRFYLDVINYVIINSLLVILWFVFEQDTVFWPKYVLAVWGIALLFKAYRLGMMPLFNRYPSFLTPEWEEKKVGELMDKYPMQRKIFLKRVGKKS